MAFTTIGDLAQSYALRLRNTDLKQSMQRLTTEVSTGLASDKTDHLGGRFRYLSQIEHDLQLVDGYRLATSEVRITASAMQDSLTRIGDLSRELATSVALAASPAGPADFSAVASQASGSLDGIVSALNNSVAGRRLFAGVAVDAAPLISADVILATLRAEVDGATTLNEVVAAVDSFFFAPGGMFETAVYKGADEDLSPYQLGNGESVDLNLRADAEDFRKTMRDVSLAALVDDSDLSLDTESRRALMRDLTDDLLTSGSRIATLQGDLGFAQERSERAMTRLESERAGLSMARTELLGIDPFTAASELEQVQQQLEMLYSITARSSRLSLVNFLS